MALNDAFFEAMRRQLRGEVEGQRQRSNRGAETSLARRGLFGESTIAANAFAGIGAGSAQAIGAGETAIAEREFQKQLAKYLHDLQKPSFLEMGLGALGGGLGSAFGSGALGGGGGAAGGSAGGQFALPMFL